jgi:hypothetical protein
MTSADQPRVMILRTVPTHNSADVDTRFGENDGAGRKVGSGRVGDLWNRRSRRCSTSRHGCGRYDGSAGRCRRIDDDALVESALCQASSHAHNVNGIITHILCTRCSAVGSGDRNLVRGRTTLLPACLWNQPRPGGPPIPTRGTADSQLQNYCIRSKRRDRCTLSTRCTRRYRPGPYYRTVSPRPRSTCSDHTRGTFYIPREHAVW